MIELQNVLPIPLKETTGGMNPESDVFNTRCLLEKGKNHLVVAPSGKGKSTFLHILYGLRKDYEGEVTLDGINIRTFNREQWSQMRQQRLALVFQDLRLFPRLTGLENCLLKTGLTQKISAVALRGMAARLGIAPILDQPCATMSYGQRQRFALLRALCQPFDFLLLDEPFSHLDEANIRAACQLIAETCREQGAGMVLVSFGQRYFFDYDAHWTL
jgi:ABC-type lipoprotein export system ATPase subunit